MFAILVGAIMLVIGAYLGFVLAFVDPVPTLAWVGFGVVVVVALLLSGVAGLLVFASDRPTLEPAERRRSAPGDDVLHLLVVANEAIGSDELRAAVCARAGGCESEVLVVAPALNTPLRHWTDDEDQAREDARALLDAELAVLAGLGIAARGEVGADDPLQAVDDALRRFPADEVVISTHPEGQVNWLEEGILRRVREAYGLAVMHVTAAS
jgi:hypothetical protein